MLLLLFSMRWCPRTVYRSATHEPLHILLVAIRTLLVSSLRYMKMLLRLLNQVNRNSKRVALLLLCLLPLNSACERKPKVITTQQIEQFLKAVDAASAKKDPQVILDHMAPDALITVKMNGPNGPQVSRFNGKDYRVKVKSELSVLKEYKYQRSDTKIEIAKDQQKARVSMTLLEFFTVPNGTYRADTKQTSIYVLKDGKLLIQAVESDSTASRVK
jgi:hypothetical protein